MTGRPVWWLRQLAAVSAEARSDDPDHAYTFGLQRVIDGLGAPSSTPAAPDPQPARWLPQHVTTALDPLESLVQASPEAAAARG